MIVERAANAGVTRASWLRRSLLLFGMVFLFYGSVTAVCAQPDDNVCCVNSQAPNKPEHQKITVMCAMACGGCINVSPELQLVSGAEISRAAHILIAARQLSSRAPIPDLPPPRAL